MDFTSGILWEKQSSLVMTNTTLATFPILANSTAGNTYAVDGLHSILFENIRSSRETTKSNLRHTTISFLPNGSESHSDEQSISIMETRPSTSSNIISTKLFPDNATNSYSDLTSPYDLANFTEQYSKYEIEFNSSFVPMDNYSYGAERTPYFCNDTSWNEFYSQCVTITPLEVFIAVVLSFLIVATIVGNVFVILAVALFHKMRTMSNFLIISLASADLLVAIVVLPISLQKEIVGQWTLGPYVCDLWITSDVFCCTASILNIVVIALDRYWLITKNVRYTHREICPRRKVCAVMLFLAWTVAALISCSPLIGWRKGTEKDDPTVCLISQEYGYTIFSTFGAFWLPLLAILLVYFKIFRFARKRATRRSRQTKVAGGQIEASCAFTQCQNDGMLTVPRAHCNPIAEATSMADLNLTPPESLQPVGPLMNSNFNSVSTPTAVSQTRDARYRKNRTKRIRRSARTLGLIIGCFLICWMPFFMVATAMPFCSGCEVPEIVDSFVLWLGYSNSLLNPAIYAIWDISFRRSFVKLATCDLR